MINFELENPHLKEIKYFNKIENLSIKKIESNNLFELNTFILDMKKLIYFFNQEYKWDKMFTIDDVYTRINAGDNLFILYFNKVSIGYIWFKKINNEISFLYNLYVTNIIKRPNESPKWFVNKTCSEILECYKKIICECEDWHKSAHNVFRYNGFNQI